MLLNVVLRTSPILVVALGLPSGLRSQTWTDELLQMTPHNACASVALHLAPRKLLTELRRGLLGKTAEQFVEQALRSTKKYKSLDTLLATLETDLEPRLGIVIRRNMRSKTTAKAFPAQHESNRPQWALVLWCKRNEKGLARTIVVNELIQTVNQHRSAFQITIAYRMSVKDTRGSSVMEFAMPAIPGTGSLVLGTIGDKIFISNSGPWLHTLLNARSGRLPSLAGTAAKKETVAKLTREGTGLCWLVGSELRALAADLAEKPVTAQPTLALLGSFGSVRAQFELANQKLRVWLRLLFDDSRERK